MLTRTPGALIQTFWNQASPRKTKGIIAVHLYGHPADMDAINHIAGVHGLWVCEDAAEAHFAKYKGRTVGSLASVSTFSFYGNKLMTCGEGGALALSDPQAELRIRTLRGQGVDPHRRYFFPITGYNFRITNLACAILCAQLERREEIIKRRRAIYDQYNAALCDVPGISFQPVAEWAEIAPWLYCILIDKETFGFSRDDVMAFLKNRGVDTRPFFIPLHTLPPFRNESSLRGEVLPVTDSLSLAGLNLPTYPTLKDEDVVYITDL